MDIFSYMYPAFKFKEKKVKLFEAFAGIGTQAMALKRLGVEVEHIGISEIDKYAIQAHRAIHGEVKNYGGIGEFEKLPPNIDICTWSFPCQDISMAGQQKGMDEGTRSNYGYVFLDTVEKMEKEERPKILLMENVEALVSSKFEKDWEEIHIRLERMGYQSYSKVLEATDYGIPQTRRRVFVVSILGNYSYTFPKPFELKKKLKDYLEDEVDEKYFLSDKMIDYLTGVNQKESKYDRAAVFERNIYKDPNIAATITTRAGSRATDNYIIEEDIEIVRELYKEHGGKIFKNHVVKDDRNKKEKLVDFLIENDLVKKGDVINHSYASNRMKDERRYKERDDGLAPTLTTRVDVLGVVVEDKEIENNLRIRKLTPLETWRLMGISDSDFNKAQESGLSDSQLYKQAGNAIVVDVLVHIFKELF